MSRIGKGAWWWARWSTAILALVLAAALWFGVRWGDASLYPASGPDTVPVYVVSNRFHSGLVLPRPELAAASGRDGRGALISVGQRFEDYDWLEVGWGEERFYRATPTTRDIDWWLALRALFWPGAEAVVHVAGIDGHPSATFGNVDLVRVTLSREGFARLLARLDAAFARDAAGQPRDLGAGLYGPSLFYRAVGRFSFANVCNHWTAGLLDAAGVPVSPLLATLPRGLVLDLEWRSGLEDAHPTAAR